SISSLGVLFAACLGTAVGLFAGRNDGVAAQVMMRISDFLFSFPSFVLAIFLMVVLGFGARNTMVAIALIYLPVFVRLARNLTVVARDDNYVRAARINGQSGASIMFREILPNILPPLLVQLTLGIAFGIVIEAGLSFLGLGVQPPAPSLGSIMADGREYFERAPWVLTLTGLFISFALLGLNLLGDGLRDLTDPRLKA
ncbi:MAG: ABC transporter permease, partial [Pollutimonas bauzanensis]